MCGTAEMDFTVTELMQGMQAQLKTLEVTGLLQRLAAKAAAEDKAAKAE